MRRTDPAAATASDMQAGGYFRHEAALVECRAVGKGTRIWAFAHVLPDAIIGEDCNICDHTFIENDVRIGNRVTIKCGVQVWDGVTIEDGVFVGPNATFTNDPFPRSKQFQERLARTVIKTGASIGANATILPGLTVGTGAMVGAGAVVTRDVPPLAIVTGNPARISGYVGAGPVEVKGQTEAPAEPGILRTEVDGVTIHRLPGAADLRGKLIFGEIGREVPFEVKRYFIVFGVSSKEVRGEHAHRILHQFMVCVHGRCSLLVDDGLNRREVLLDSPSVGVHVPPLVWGVQYKYSPDSVLLVLASDKYDPSDYIRDYAEFLEMRNRAR